MLSVAAIALLSLTACGDDPYSTTTTAASAELLSRNTVVPVSVMTPVFPRRYQRGNTGADINRPCLLRSKANLSRFSAAPRRLDRGDVDLLHIHHRIKRAFCFIAAGRHRLGQHARRDLPGDAPFVLAPAALRFLGPHCRRWRSSSDRSLADRQWRSGTRRLRYA